MTLVWQHCTSANHVPGCELLGCWLDRSRLLCLCLTKLAVQAAVQQMRDADDADVPELLGDWEAMHEDMATAGETNLQVLPKAGYCRMSAAATS